MTTLQKSAEIIVTKCLGLKSSEKCLIIIDEPQKSIGKVLFETSKNITSQVEIIQIPIAKVNGEEPSHDVASRMLDYDVIIIPTTKSLTHTRAVGDAQKNGARIASMPGITEDMMKRAIDVDYHEMKKMTNDLADILDKGKKVRIISALGTDMIINISERKAYGRKSGILTSPGDRGNLPEGEAFIAPMQSDTEGTYIVDASQAGVGILNNPIKIIVKNGYVVDIEGGQEANKFKDLLESIDDKNAFNVAEFGIGTNKSAIITGNVLEDEKVFGTCHIALGKNDSFGGDIDVPIHVDGVIKEPTIFIDDKEIMRNGKLLI